MTSEVIDCDHSLRNLWGKVEVLNRPIARRQP
jgi:hypothetical protein